MPMNERPPVLPWLALAAVLGTVAALVPALLDINGPWTAIAAGLAALGALLALLSTNTLRAQWRQWSNLHARAKMAETERNGLLNELQRHNQLEQQLLLAKQAAESAAMAKGEFLATMSHEIRTPLNGIVPMLEMLSRAPLAPDQREMLKTASASSHQLLRIVDDILDYSKLEANKLELEITGFNLRELLDGVLQLMHRPAENKGLRLSLQMDPAVRLPVRGDPVRLRQVLSNLLGNAIKFTERGTITVVVRRLGETAAQHLLRFEVRDSGIGIDDATQARLFRSFSQADASTTRLYGGTGLGLVICKRIVDLMGGRIDVVSEVGQGSTFWFEIPLMKVVGDLRPSGGSGPDLGRVLLISPDARLRQRITLLLSNWGMRITTVETTQEALDRLRGSESYPVGGQANHYLAVLADVSGIRSTARALHRALARRNDADALRLIWLYGDDAVPAELQPGATLLSRQAPDADLRAALLNAPPTEEAMPQEPETIELFPAPVNILPTPPAQPAPFLPAAPASAPATPAERGDAAIETRDVRLLLVEDNPVNLLVAQKLLGALGYGCQSEPNGDLAFKRMCAEPFDLVFMDCQMPVLDGYAATRRWREYEAGIGAETRLPVIAMTANAMAGDRQRCLDAGMDDYLAKPVSRDQLENCLQRWLPDMTRFSLRNAPPPATEEPSTPSSLPLSAERHTTVLAAPVLDQSMLEELREIAGSETARIIALFLEDAPKLIATLEKAAALPDLDAMRDAAHTLKSSSANVGAMALSAAAKRVELGARAAKLDRPAVAVALVIAEYARARMALQGYAAQQLGQPLGTMGGSQSSSFVSR